MPRSGETMLLDRATIDKLIEYRPRTGEFIWRVDRNSYAGQIKAGSVAGTPQDGYIQITIEQRTYRAHRLAWFLMTGSFPPKGSDIDHIDRDRANNCWPNLRLATRSQNNMNAGLRSNNTSGVTGVSFDRRRAKWHARVVVEHRTICLGDFHNFDEAVAARRAAEGRYFGEFAAAI